MGTSQNGFNATMSPGASFGRFKISLQRNGEEAEQQMRAGNNSTFGNMSANKANPKLLPMVSQLGSPLNSKRQGFGVEGRTMQSYDKALISHSPDPISRGQRILDNVNSSPLGSAVLRSNTPNQIILEGFGGFEDVSDEDIVEHEGFCYLKTKTESYKKHWMMLTGNELRFYRKQGDSDHKVMHCLAGTYLKDVTMDEISEKSKSSATRSKASTVQSKASKASS